MIAAVLLHSLIIHDIFESLTPPYQKIAEIKHAKKETEAIGRLIEESNMTETDIIISIFLCSQLPFYRVRRKVFLQFDKVHRITTQIHKQFDTA